MKIENLSDIPPWEWPQDADTLILNVLQDHQATTVDRHIAAELAGDMTVINDELTNALLSILSSSKESEELRGQAAISLGPILEYADTEGFDDESDETITEEKFHQIQTTLRKLYMDADVPQEVRRRILEAAVRAPQDWQLEAIRAAYADNDETWRLTGVFCMQYVRGFNEQILEALSSENPAIQYHAICAAGNWEIDAAWSHITAILSSANVDKDLLLAAIDATASIRPQEARLVLDELSTSKDEDIVDAVEEALLMAQGLSEIDFDDEDFDDEDFDDGNFDDGDFDDEDSDDEDSDEEKGNKLRH